MSRIGDRGHRVECCGREGAVYIAFLRRKTKQDDCLRLDAPHCIDHVGRIDKTGTRIITTDVCDITSGNIVLGRWIRKPEGTLSGD